MSTPSPEEIAAAEATNSEDAAGNARTWLLQTLSGTLCTLSRKPGLEGWPFGSVVPFALTATGHPVIYIAKIAAHTANLKADNRASLFVSQPGIEGDPQKGWRITLMGRMQELVTEDTPNSRSDHPKIRISREEHEEIHARYAERVPFAPGYEETHDFTYWRMGEIEKVRYIGGFGKITWLEGSSILRDPAGAGMGEAASGAIAHMNDDHVQNMVEMCQGLGGISPEHAEMAAVDRTGFLVRTRGPERLLHFSFGREIEASQLRVAVIEVLQRARRAASEREAAAGK